MDPFYDPALSYEQNYVRGPFGVFVEPVADGPMLAGDPAHRFVGIPVRTPFGIPAGPLLNARFAAAAFAHGFDVCVYKTVRTRAHACHPFPNVLAVHVDGDLTPERARRPLVADDDFAEPRSISNSFGVPSRDPDRWQPDMAAAVAAAATGQVLVGGFQGTKGDGGAGAYVADHVRAARLVVETGAPVLELNLSCPNEGTSALLCFDVPRVRRILEAVKEEIGDVPLLVKLAHFPDNDALRTLVAATATLVAGYSAINTIPARLVTPGGAQALPGRDVSGVCGAAIRWAGLDMVRRLARARDDLGHDVAIVGVGGVTTPADVLALRAAGADAVMSATGAMWNPNLGHEVRAVL
ncbi:tRNA-dihydrouridine synthase [Microbacterium telephonicum]|uniref:Dihydroorotate dehydrogenase n=1 Tax=Microbacterium telephonicum TaxID=1714841 RepID=A0A498C510_9MICO|nr:tRNA-dihydrouridine synthase [Microbacterium telephonicum]RLK48090.1 dihydroorotate dehydrogenase [Microbacterium telephonicum]